MKKKVHKLNITPEYEFKIIGISSHENDYRLTWALNNNLSFAFQKSSPLDVYNKKLKTDQQFSIYAYHDEDSLLSYHLISNNGDNGYLVKDMSYIDFFLKITGEGISDFFLNELTKNLKSLNIISTAYLISVDTFKEPSKFLF
jgi:hypothetical protein